MGAYLSEPITEKFSNDDSGVRMSYGASSMQGWRVSQEDAHNCLLDFDKDTSMFAVYDGHGGHEVAAYCSQKLPDFIKSIESYKAGDLENALIDAFLKFDATLASRDVVDVLKAIAERKDKDGDDSESEDDEENVKNLYEEAAMPIEQVIEKYQANFLHPHFKKLQEKRPPVSPYLRGPRDGGECSGSSVPSSSSSSSGSKDKEVEADSTSNQENLQKAAPVASDAVSTTSEAAAAVPDSSADVAKLPEENGLVEDKKSGGVTSSTPQENGAVLPGKKKGKDKALVRPEPKTKRLPREAKNLYDNFLQLEGEASESEDENDKTFDGGPEHSSSDEEDESRNCIAEDEDEEEEEEEEETSEEDDDEDDGSLMMEEDEVIKKFNQEMIEEPGSDSGCTAVVALLKNNKLVVANAGDSRCVVCRAGKAVEMSFDHKPEDEPEMERILKAGGKVTEGRVNGGLNLSRAFGDHAYKRNTDLSDKEQMITALPDIRALDIDPVEDEFMVLACDGVWNYMSSQVVVDFVRDRLRKGEEKLSKICEELFDHCLAPDTKGDGTGCDNMTAVIVKFHHHPGSKRAASEEESNDVNCKKAKTDDGAKEAEDESVVASTQ